MAKNPKTDQPDASSNGETTNVPSETTAAPKQRAKAAKSSSKKPVAKKASSKNAAKKAAPRQSPKKSAKYEPSEADVRLRAYFIAERRVQLALQGDPAEDWIEARQQLLDEAAQKR